MRIISKIIDLKFKQYNPILLKQMDTTRLNFKLLDENTILNLNNKTVSIIFYKPDKTVVIQSSNITVNALQGTITATLLADCLRLYGNAQIEVEIKDTSNNIVSSFIIPGIIEKTNKNEIQSSNTPNYIEYMQQAIANLITDSEDLLETIREEYDGIVDDVTTLISNYNNIFSEIGTQVAENVTKYTLKITETINSEINITIPCNYKVGANVLDVFLNGERLVKSTPEMEGNYFEVGMTGSISNTIKLDGTNEVWNVENGDIFEFVLRGIYTT